MYRSMNRREITLLDVLSARSWVMARTVRWLLALSLASSASSARLELLQTESHLLPTAPAAATAASSPTPRMAELDPVLSPEEAAAAPLPMPSIGQRAGRATPRRVLEASDSSAVKQPPPTLTQRLLHPFRVLAAEQLSNSGAAQMLPMELVMTCSVVGMGVLGAVWCAALPLPTLSELRRPLHTPPCQAHLPYPLLSLLAHCPPPRYPSISFLRAFSMGPRTIYAFASTTRPPLDAQMRSLTRATRKDIMEV